MNITEYIMARSANRAEVAPGQIVTCKLDLICIDEIQIPIFAKTLAEMGESTILRDKTIFVIDHYCPPTSIHQATVVRQVRDFASIHNCKLLEGGIKHQLLLEGGYARPGIMIAATDSHINTCGAVGAFATAFGPAEAAMMASTGFSWFRVPETIKFEITGQLYPFITSRDIGLAILGERGLNFANYMAIEFWDRTEKGLSIEERMALCNMSAEMGAKAGVFEVDDITKSFLLDRGIKDYQEIPTGRSCHYAATFHTDISRLQPMIALPDSPANVTSVDKVVDNKIDQAFIGSCLGGNIEDLRVAARIFDGHKVYPGTRVIITPASRQIYREALSEGLIEVFSSANAHISGGTCSVCIGAEAPLLAGESCISTSTRNYKGRMGSSDSHVYLASSATVAASALRGRITDPREFL
jgi:3-isopropylmalate/(R)-2-methylmalate dehydratase large subunit